MMIIVVLFLVISISLRKEKIFTEDHNPRYLIGGYFISGKKSESETSIFYTSSNGLMNLVDSSGDGYLDIQGEDAPNIKKIEVSVVPVRPFNIESGVEKLYVDNLENQTIYSFAVTDKDNHRYKDRVPLNDDLVGDVDFNIYTTVKTVNQTWSRENLKVSRGQNAETLCCYRSAISINSVVLEGKNPNRMNAIQSDM